MLFCAALMRPASDWNAAAQMRAQPQLEIFDYTKLIIFQLSRSTQLVLIVFAAVRDMRFSCSDFSVGFKYFRLTQLINLIENGANITWNRMELLTTLFLATT